VNDLIFLSLEDWDEIWRRNQFVCATLARRHPETKILFVGLPRHAPRLVMKGKISAAFGNATYRLPDLPNITITKPLRLAPESTEWGLAWNQRLYRKHVGAAAAKLGMRQPILWINPQWAWHVQPYVSHAAMIYDITDDWTTLTQKELDLRRTISADRTLCKMADATIVCSEKLRELKTPLVPAAERLHLIPNGVDAAHYAAVLQPGPVPPELAELPRPVFGYTGTIHPDRLDVELLLQVAERITGSIALVGPSYLSATDVARLKNTGRVRLFPAVPYSQIPTVMRGFDVTITPHRMTAFTESLNPIKLWEYLAAGKPIVSTDVAGFRDYPQHVRIAATADAFAVALQAAAAEAVSPAGKSAAAARQAEARAHSWESRITQIESVLASAVEIRRTREHETTMVLSN